MAKNNVIILLTIPLMILLGLTGCFWYNQKQNNTGIKISGKNDIIQYSSIYRYMEDAKKIDTNIDISGWKIYQNNEMGISIKYPKTLTLTQDKNNIKIKHAKSGRWVGTLEVSKGEDARLDINQLSFDEGFQSIIEWQKEGYILTENGFVALMRGVFKNTKKSKNKKSDLLGLGYLFEKGKPVVHIMLDASYKIKNDIWYGIIKSIKII